MSFNVGIFRERTVDFVLYLENTKNIAWCDISGRKLDPLPPHSHKTLEFKCIPLVPGLRTLSGIKLMDTFLKRTHTYDELGHVFVILAEDKVGKLETPQVM